MIQGAGTYLSPATFDVGVTGDRDLRGYSVRFTLNWCTGSHSMRVTSAYGCAQRCAAGNAITVDDAIKGTVPLIGLLVERGIDIAQA